MLSPVSTRQRVETFASCELAGRTTTCLSCAPVTIKPPMGALSADWRRRRDEILPRTVTWLVVAVGVGVAVAVAVAVAAGVAVAVAVAVAVGVEVAVAVGVEVA